MAEITFKTEAEVISKLTAVASLTDEAPHIFVAFREQAGNKLNRQVTFVIQTRENNEALVNNIIAESVRQDRAFIFLKSDINTEDGLLVDYLYVQATITPQLTI